MRDFESKFNPELWTAIETGNVSEVDRLVKAGLDFSDAGDDDGYSPLHQAAQLGNKDIVRALLKGHGVERLLNTFDDVSHTPLIWAAKEGHLEAARILIAAGADVNAHQEAKIGNTALREAAENGTPEMIKLLMDAGADPLIPGWMRITPLFKAEKRYSKKPNEDNGLILTLMRKRITH